MKTCTVCHQSKGLDQFYKNRRTSDGLCWMCKCCEKARKTKDYAKNKKKIRVRHKTYYTKNRKKCREQQADYRRRNPGLFHAKDAKRRASLEAACCDCCSDDVIRKFYSNRPEGYHVDHVKPLSNGGLHCIRNLQYLEAALNLMKGTKEIIYL